VLSIGIIGASRIAKDAVLDPSLVVDGVEVLSVAASQHERARNYAAQHNIPRAEQSYDCLLDNDDIDLIYIGLPPAHHETWTMRALRAGKNVLCEKPLSLDAASVVRMTSLAEELGLQLIEGMHCRFHPLFQHILSLSRLSAFGAINHVDAHFNVPVPNEPGEFRYSSMLGGGALMDLGCYPIHWVRTVIGSEPEIVSASSQFHASRVDLQTEALLKFSTGATASVRCSMDPALPIGVDAKMKISSSQGWIEVDNPLQPGLGSQLQWQFGDQAGHKAYGGDTFRFQLEHTVRVINGTAAPVTGGADSIANMSVIDGIKAAVANQQTASVNAA